MRKLFSTAVPIGAIILQSHRAYTFTLPVFSVCSTQRTAFATTRPLLARNEGGDDEDDVDAPDDADLERVRQSLEELLVDDSPKSSDEYSSSKNTPILTAARRRNLEREIELLTQLTSPDEDEREGLQQHNQDLVMAQMWDLWYGERGLVPEQELKEIERVQRGGPSNWPEAEERYRALIEKHCQGSSIGRKGGEGGNISMDAITIWAEPSNRLATLLFLMERYGESKILCERILRVKPWHIGALSGIVLVCMKLKDEEGARYWAVRGLPNTSKDMRPLRQAWVKRHVLEAKVKLKEMELATKEAFGRDDKSSATDDQTTDGGDDLFDDSGDEFTPVDTILDYDADADLFEDYVDCDYNVSYREENVGEETSVEGEDSVSDKGDDFSVDSSSAWQ